MNTDFTKLHEIKVILNRYININNTPIEKILGKSKINKYLQRKIEKIKVDFFGN